MAAAGAVAGAAVVGGVAMAASSSRASSRHSSPSQVGSPMPSATPLTIPLVHNASRASSHKSHRSNPSRQSGVSVDHQSGVAHESVVSDARYTNVGSPSGSRASSRQSRVSQRSHHSDVVEALRTMPQVDKAQWKELDPISRWLIASRASVLLMTFTSCAVGGLLALQDGVFNGFYLVLVMLGLLLAHATNNQLNDLTDSGRGIDSDDYHRNRYGELEGY